MVYDVEKMTRMEVYTYISAFVDTLENRPALQQLATIEANRGIMLRYIATKDRLDAIALSRALCRLLAYSPPGDSTERTACLIFLQTTATESSLLQRLLRYVPLSLATAEQALLVLSAWDVVLHTMAPTEVQTLKPSETGVFTPRLRF
ncbi:unnamed protein product [Peronospora farinosa]|uniref:Uncharacterized protein n=1 Tax=Peronospora farinosa TaxID=134698 RepID=A0AAV0SWW4_9STRA|nr:unnamed protein product [Peronospora farinosa]